MPKKVTKIKKKPNQKTPTKSKDPSSFVMYIQTLQLKACCWVLSSGLKVISSSTTHPQHQIASLVSILIQATASFMAISSPPHRFHPSQFTSSLTHPTASSSRETTPGWKDIASQLWSMAYSINYLLGSWLTTEACTVNHLLRRPGLVYSH